MKSSLRSDEIQGQPWMKSNPQSCLAGLHHDCDFTHGVDLTRLGRIWLRLGKPRSLGCGAPDWRTQPKFGENNLFTFYIIYTILARLLLDFFEKKLKKLCFSQGNRLGEGNKIASQLYCCRSDIATQLYCLTAVIFASRQVAVKVEKVPKNPLFPRVIEKATEKFPLLFQWYWLRQLYCLTAVIFASRQVILLTLFAVVDIWK